MKNRRSNKAYSAGPLMTEMEPRVLLSADLPGGLADPDKMPAGFVPVYEPPVVAEQLDWSGADAAVTQSRELVIVDAATPDYKTLINDLMGDRGDGRIFEVVILDADKDGIAQISELLGERSGLTAVHIISHGSDGSMTLGNSVLDYDGLIANAKTIQGWGEAFSADGDLLIYGCDLAAGIDGQAFINTLGLLTGADVAASTDLTGDAAKGGDWELEYRRGVVEADIAFSAAAQQQWSGLLSPVTLTSHEVNNTESEIKSNQNAGQTFSYTSGNGTYTVQNLELQLRQDTGGPAQNITVSLRASWDGPDLASASIAKSSLGTSFAWENFALGDVVLNDGQAYYIRITSDSNAGKVFVGYDNASAYANGDFLDQNGIAQTGEDMAFRVIYNNAVPATANIEAGALAYTEDDGAVPITSAITVSDSDHTNLQSATIQITAGYLSGADVLAFTDTANITGSWDAGTGTLTLTGVDTLAAYQSALRAVTYNTSDDPGTNTRTVSFTVSDGLEPSNTVTRDIAVTPLNDAPVLAPVAPVLTPITEDDIGNGGHLVSSIVAATITDVDTGAVEGIAITATTVTGPGAWEYSIDGGSNWFAAGAVTNNSALVLRSTDLVRFKPDGANSATGSFDFRAWDRTDGATEGTKVDASATGGTEAFSVASDTASIVIGAVNDAPVITSDGGGATAAVNAAENQAAVTTVTWTDVDLPADSITLSLSGDDAALFSIDAGGVLTFNTAPDFENPTDFDADGVYDVTVTVDDNAGGIDTQAISVTVTDAPGIDVDSTSTDTITTSGSSTTFSHTTNSEGDRLMLVGISFGWDSGDSVSSITYNGDNLTRVGFTSAGFTRTEIWSLVAPDSGTHNVQVNLTGNSHRGASIGVMTFDGVDQSTPLSGFTTANGVSTTPSVTVSSADGELVFGVMSQDWNADHNITPGAGQTEHWDLFSVDKGNSSGTTEAGAASVVTSWTTPLSQEWSAAGVSIKPSVGNQAPTDIQISNDNIDENTNTAGGFAVGTLTATDPDIGDTFSYSIVGGADLGVFTIGGASLDELILTDGVLDFENPNDFDADGVYEVTVRVTDDGAPNLSYDETLFISINDLNEAPVITSNGGGATAAINAAENQTAVTTVTYSDEDVPADSITYSLSGNDATLFNIDAGGVLTFVAAPDFESPTDFDADGVYDVTVTVDDNAGSTDSQDISVTVTDVNDAPVITSDGGGATAAINAAENQTAVTTVTWADQDLPADSITYSLSGNDAALFNIDAGGVLTFVAAPDFENPTDFDADGVYDVTVTVDDNAGSTDSQDISVSVTDVNDAPVITSNGGGATAAINAAENQTAVTTVTYTDEDVPADSITYSLSGNDAALFNIDAGGVLTFVAAPDFENPTDFDTDGVYDVTVTVDDNAGSTDSQDISVTVTDVNDAPVITSDGGGATAAVNAAENQTAVTTVTYSDEDVPADSITYSLSGDDAALFNIDAGGVLTFVAAPDFENPTDFDADGVYDVTVTVDDNAGATDSQDIAVTVTDQNDAPIITSDGGGATAAINAAENQTSVTTVTYSDEDVPADSITYLLSGNDAALFNIDAFGVLTFITAPDFETPTDFDADGVYDVTVTVDDNAGGIDTQDISVTVTDQNDAPVITSDGGGATAAINAAENQTSVTTVTWTDQDVPADSITYSLSGNDAALFNIDAGGVLTFITAPDFEAPTDFDADGVYDVTVTVDDNAGSTDSQDISVTVTDDNDAPVITSDGGGATAAINAAENQTAVTTVTYTDADVPADSITYSLSGNDVALFSIDAFGVLTFITAPDFEAPTDFDADGVYDVTVTVDDNAGGTDTQDISVTVTDQNDAPVITSDGGGATAAINAAENQTAVTTVTYTDADVPADSITYSLSGNDAALFTIDAFGVLTFIAAPDFETPTDFDADGVYDVTVTVDDNAGGTDTQDISVTVTDVNDAPVITSDGGGATAAINAAENQTAVTTVTYTDQDVPADSITYSLSGNDAALFTIDAGGVLTFITAPDFETPTDFDTDGVYDVTVTVDDNAGGTDTQDIAVTVTPQNDAPVITSDGGGATAAINAAENQTAVTTVTYTDADVPADSITYSLSGNDAALFSIDAFGVLTFITAPDFETPTDFDADGVYDVTVTVDDNAGGIDTQDISVTVTDQNDAPVITSDGGGATAAINAAENQTAVTTVTWTDQDVPADSITYSLSGNDAALFNIDAFGVLTFITAPDFEAPTDFDADGVYDVTVTVDDNAGGTDTQDISVTVTDQNDAPVITSDGGGATAAINAAENQTAVTTVTYTDADVPADSITYSLSGNDVALFSIDAFGVLTFITAPDFEAPTDFDADGVYDVTVTVDDNAGGTDTQDISVTVTDANDAPVITSDGGGATAAINAAENQTAVTTVTYTDQDVPADSITYSLSGNDAALFNIDAFGVLTFIAAPDFETPTDFDADGVYDVTVTVDDNAGGIDTQDISVTVTDINDAPVITSDGGGPTAALNAAENQTAVTTVTWTDADVPADSITYSLSGNDAALFTIDAFGVLTFITAPDFEAPTDFDADGVYDVTVTVDDNAGGTDTQDISVTVTDANDAPVITSDGGGATAAINAAENQTAVTTVTYTDADVPTDSITYSLSGNDAALFSIDAFGVLTFITAPDFEAPTDFDADGVYDVTVTVDDNAGATDSQDISVTVTDQNDAPVITSDGGGATAAINAAENQTAVTTVTYTDADVPADSITYSLSGNDAALFTIDAFGVLTFITAPDFEAPTDFDADGVYDVTVTVDDNAGGTDSQDISVTVTDANDAPTAVGDAFTVNEDTNLIAVLGVDDLLLNDSDPDGDPLTVDVVPVAGPTQGSVTLNADGTFTYVPNPNFNGSDAFTYRISDGNGGFAQATVMITVDPVNDAPSAGIDAYNVNEDTALAPPLASGLLLNDADVDGDPMTVAATPVSNPSNGLLILNPDGTFTYTPNADFNGTDGFSYEISDGNGGLDQATVTITVDPVNDAPTGTNDSVAAVSGNPVVVDEASLVANDVDVDGDLLTFTSFTQPANGTVVDNGNGTVTYTPNVNFTGVDNFSYTMSDPSGAQSTALVVVNVTTGGPGTFGDEFDPGPDIEPPNEDPVLPPADDEPTDDPVGDPTDDPADEPPSMGGDPLVPPIIDMPLPIGPSPTNFIDGLTLADDPDDHRDRGLAQELVDGTMQILGEMLDFEGFSLENVNLDHDLLLEALDTVKREMSGTGQNPNAAFMVQITMGSGLLLTAGYISWILRGGALAASLLSTMPMWRSFDPIPLLAARKRKRIEEEEKEKSESGRVAGEQTASATQKIDKLFGAGETTIQRATKS